MKNNLRARTRARPPAAPRRRLNLILAAAVAGCAFTARAQQATLDPVLVTGVRSSVPAGAALDGDALRGARPGSSDTARLLSTLPGVALYGAGGVSSLPSVHGLADDRLRIQLDGMDLVSACGNHMNPPLSYIDPTRVGSVKLFAGIVPVSMGGDSIGATIEVESQLPEFVEPGQPAAVHGEAGVQYRSNGNGQAANASASYAAAAWSLRYDGSVASSGNYRAARDFKAAGPAASDKPGRWLGGDEVGSSGYLVRNHALAVATRREGHLVQLKVGVQDIGSQGFPNQRMDMTRNDGTHVNLLYRGEFAWGNAQVRAYAERTRHSMNFGEDKQFWYGPSSNVPGMPMETKGRNLGLQGKAEVRPTTKDTVRFGVEAQHYRLDDWWPPSGGGMAPDTFWNIREGRRDRLDAFGEWESQWNSKWLASVGLRSANVTTDAGPVQGYNASYATDANAFNARARRRVDNNIDFAALARYTPGATASYEFGYARKTRSPNLYERFAWSTGGMAMRMINLAGDGNGYVGNLDLRPEVAHTLSATADWHDPAGESWQLKFTPYFTRVDDYVDAARCTGAGSTCNAANAAATRDFVYLRFANDDARLHGFDLSGFAQVARTRDWGTFTAVGQLGYVRGKNLGTGDGLYNIMPLNSRVALVQRSGAWTAAAEVQLVAGKIHVSQVRNELKTAGYGLVNLRASYEWTRVRLDVGVENLLDRFYNPPLGGAYLGQGRTMAATAVPWGVPVPGPGRSVNVAVAVKY